MHIEKAGKLFYCPIKSNRKVDDSGGKTPYKAVTDLEWFGDEILRGKRVKIQGFPTDYKVKLFRVAATNRTEYVATNDPSQDSAIAVKDICGIRWKTGNTTAKASKCAGWRNASAARPAPRKTISAAQYSLGIA